MVNLRRAAAAVCTALPGSLLLTGCGFLSSSTPAAVRVMSIGSDAFIQNVLPKEYTCNAVHPITPPISWSGAPDNTVQYALVFDDASAPITPYIYWLVVGIQPGTTDIEQGMLPSGARSAPNSANVSGYTAPCPHGSAHKYRFTIYALSKALNLPANATMEATWQAIAAAGIVGRGRYEVTANP
jgi:Raf kinase inhibitor-like YbhB/YbcL family protein